MMLSIVTAKPFETPADLIVRAQNVNADIALSPRPFGTALYALTSEASEYLKELRFRTLDSEIFTNAFIRLESIDDLKTRLFQSGCFEKSTLIKVRQ